MIKNLVASLALAVTIGGFGYTVFNAQAAEINGNEEIEEVTEMDTRLTTSTYLSTGGYSNVRTLNNILTWTPSITNNANNPGKISARVLDSDGNIISKAKDVAKGATVDLAKVSWNSATVVVQAKALDKAGTYSIAVN